jgi:hypothetical protein
MNDSFHEFQRKPPAPDIESIHGRPSTLLFSMDQTDPIIFQNIVAPFKAKEKPPESYDEHVHQAALHPIAFM